MTIFIETKLQADGRFFVMTYEVTGENRKPVENVFYGWRSEIIQERSNRIDHWSSIASNVSANAIPCLF